MKKTWTLGTLAAFVVALGSLVAAQQATTKPAAPKPAVKKASKSLPAAVSSAFEAAYPKAVITNTARETENGRTVFEVESVDKGMNRDLLYAADGTVLECEEQIKEADVPAPVLAALKQLYPKARITKAEKTTKGQVLQYDLALEGAPKAEVSFLPDGKPVQGAPEKK